MKKLLFALLMTLCISPVQAQNVEGQPIAAQFGQFQVPASQSAFIFPPFTCTVTAGGVNFPAFSAGTPVKIVDANPALTEIATPTQVNISACSVQMATQYTHTPPFYLTSGTGGLQEAIIAAPNISGTNTIVLNSAWYDLVGAANTQSVIAAVKGNTGVGLVDVTQTPYATYSWNGSQYVSAGGGGGGSVTYNQGGTGAVTRGSTAKWQDSISYKDFGPDGTAVGDTTALTNALDAASATGKSLFVPAGTWPLHNATAPAVSGAYNVVIIGEGPASAFVCDTIGSYDCIASTGATGFGLSKLSVSYGPTATTRSSGYAVDIETCTSCTISDVTLSNGDLSGLRLASSIHTQIRNLKVANFEANGTFMVNNLDLRINGLACANDGDACFETSWFDSEYTAHSVPCQDITASDITSNSDVEALLINSCNNVSVSNVTSLNSAKEAIFIGQDPTTTTVQWPDRITINGMNIYGSGYGSNPLNVATAQGILVNVGTTPTGNFVSHVAISGVVGTHISGWGLQMAELQDVDLQLSNVQFSDVGQGNTVGCLLTQGNQVNLSGITCTTMGTYGLYAQNTKRLTGANLVFNGANQASAGLGGNAVYLSSSETGFVQLSGVSLNDTNSSTYSSSVYDASTSGYHMIWNIWSQGLASITGPTSANSATTYTYADTGHSFVFRNGGMIQSFVPPNYYFLPTAGATPTQYVNGAVLYYQSKCWASGAQQTESVGWLDQYPTLSTESFSFNHFGGCGFPIVIDMTAASSVSSPTINDTGTVIAQHFGGYPVGGTYPAAPTFVAGSGAGAGPTLSPNGQNTDVSGYLSVTSGTSPAASAVIATGTFGVAYATLAKCSLWPANAAASALSGSSAAFVPVGSNTAFAITSGSTALAASTLYTFGYQCTQ